MDVIKNYVVIFIITVWYNGFNIHTSTLTKSLNGVTWMDAKTMCGNQGLEFRKDTLEQITDRQHEFWIGLAVYKIKSWMELKGCGYFSDTSQLQDTANIVMCQQGCKNSKYFAYKIRKCVCISSISNPMKYVGISACLKNDDLPYYYLYSHFNGHYTETGEGDCMTIIPNCKNATVQLRQEDCSSSQISSRCGHGFNVGIDTNTNQTKTMKKCQERDILLTPSSGECGNNLRQDPEPVWTNVVRRTYKVETDRLNDKQTPTQCLTATVLMKDNIPTVATTRRDCNSTFTYFACRFTDDSTPKMSTMVTSNTTKLLQTPIPSMSASSLTTLKSTTATALKTTLRRSSMPASPASSLTTLKSTTATALKTTLRRSSMPASPALKSTSATALNTTLRRTLMQASREITKHQSMMTTYNIIISTLLPATTEPVPTVLQYGTVVGVIIGVIIVLAIVSTVIICRIRSNGIFRKFNIKSNDNITLNEISNAPRAPASPSYTNDNNITYAQVMKEGCVENAYGRKVKMIRHTLIHAMMNMTC